MLQRLLLSSLLFLIISTEAFAGVPVLVYHRVIDDQEPGMTIISKKRFTEHLDTIKNLGYKTLTISELTNYLERGNTPENAIVITFDDGFIEHGDFVANELRARNMAATFYIITSAFDNKNLYLSREDVLKLDENKMFEIGAHSHTHFVQFEKDLSNLDYRIMIGEVFMSKSILETLLKKPIKSFAWPYGHYNNKITPYLKSTGFVSFVHVNNESNIINETNPYFINRINVDGKCTAEDLITIIKTNENKECVK